MRGTFRRFTHPLVADTFGQRNRHRLGFIAGSRTRPCSGFLASRPRKDVSLPWSFTRSQVRDGAVPYRQRAPHCRDRRRDQERVSSYLTSRRSSSFRIPFWLWLLYVPRTEFRQRGQNYTALSCVEQIAQANNSSHLLAVRSRSSLCPTTVRPNRNSASSHCCLCPIPSCDSRPSRSSFSVSARHSSNDV